MGVLLAGLLAAALVGAACAKSAPTTAGTTGGSPRGGGGGYGGGNQYGGGGGGTPSAGGVTLQQGAGGFVFSPADFTVKQGETITVSNVGTAPHTFTVQGQGIDITNSPGQSAQVTIDLPPGTYTYICSFHVQLGMQGTLTVTS